MRSKNTSEAGGAALKPYLIAICVVLLSVFLAACNTRSALDPASPSAASQAGVEAAGDLALAQSSLQGGDATAAPLAASAGGNRVMFAPIIGASSTTLPALSNRLSARARQRGIAIVEQGGSAPIIMKGYFSAFADGSQTTVIYVWDVLDPSGNRLHRIQGQQAAPGGNGDGWSSVNNATMEAVADDTIQQLAAWMVQRTG